MGVDYEGVCYYCFSLIDIEFNVNNEVIYLVWENIVLYLESCD